MNDNKNKKDVNKTQRGITLIALIATIVILVILVAVIIDVAVDGKLFDTAKDVVGKTNNKAGEEQNRIDNMVNEWDNSETGIKGNTETECTHSWSSWKTTTVATCTTEGTQTRTCSRCGNVETQIIVALGHKYGAASCTEPQKCTICGETTGAALGHNIVNGMCTRCGMKFGLAAEEVANNATTYYGKVVENYTANGIEYKVFYASTSRIYLIASDYVHNSKLTRAYTNGASCSNPSKYPYDYCWPNGPTTYDATGRQDTLFMATSILTDDYDSSKCVSGLLNTNNWIDFVDKTYADYAIGGPTMEMFVASWNAKKLTKLFWRFNKGTSMGGMTFPDSGYFVGTSETPSDDFVRLPSGMDDSLYLPNGNAVSNCYGYWLAARSSRFDSYIYNVNCNPLSRGLLTSSCTTGYSNGTGVRPVVALQVGVIIKENANGTVSLVK